MDGKTDQTKDALPGKGQPSGSEVSPSKPEPESFTREQMETLMSEKHSTLDKQIASLGKDLKESQMTVAAKESELASIAEERGKLQSEIADLTSDDPKKFDVIKRDRELSERERKLKTDIATLETEKQTHGERVNLAESTLREISIWEISAKHEGADPMKLKDVCDLAGATTEEQITKVADTLWGNKAKGPGTPTLVPFSGKTSGGGRDLSNLSASDLLEEGFKQLKK